MTRESFRPSRTKWVFVLIAATLFTAVGLLMIKFGGPVRRAPFGDAHFWGWFVVVFFGIAIPISLLELVSSHFSLSLSPDGFSFGTLWGRKSTPWSAIASFRAEVVATRSWPLPPMELVRYHYTPTYADSTRTRVLGRRSGGLLPDTYGMSAESLAERMNEWRLRYSA